MRHFLFVLFFFSALQLYAQPNSERREFRGFSSEKRGLFRINFVVEGDQMYGYIQHESDEDSIIVAGEIDTTGRFILKGLDHDNQFNGITLKGRMKGERIRAVYSDGRKPNPLNLEEVDLNSPPKFEARSAFRQISRQFSIIILPATIVYKENAREIFDYNEFLQQPIQRFGQSPFTMAGRTQYVRKVGYGGRVEFDNDVTGLIIHLHMADRIDGNYYLTFMSVYADEIFTTAYVLFEQKDDNLPAIVSRISSDRLLISEYGTTRYIFHFDENGEMQLHYTD